MTPSSIFLIGGLAVMWFLQLFLSYWQMKRFYKRVGELRRDGRVAIGMGGGLYKGRQYGVLCVDAQDRIVHAEQLSGWTIMAKLKPVPALEGQALSAVLDETTALPVSKKQAQAFRQAATFIRDAAQKAASKAVEGDRHADELLASSTAA